MAPEEKKLNLTFEVQQIEDHYLLEAKLTANKEIIDHPEIKKRMEECSLIVSGAGCIINLESNLHWARAYFVSCEGGYRSEKLRVTPRPRVENPFSGLEAVLCINGKPIHRIPIKDYFSSKK